jgi:hypothetical protein
MIRRDGCVVQEHCSRLCLTKHVKKARLLWSSEHCYRFGQYREGAFRERVGRYEMAITIEKESETEGIVPESVKLLRPSRKR